MPDASTPRVNALKVFLTTLVGTGITVSTFLLSDAALPEDTPWWVRWVMAAVSLVSYAIGATATIMLIRRDAEKALSSALMDSSVNSTRLEDEKERHQIDLERLSKAEEEITKLRNLLDAQKTLTSSYEKKYAELSARIDNEEKAAEDNLRVERFKQGARSLSAENKLLLLYLSDNGTLDVAIDDFKLQEFLDDAMSLVTITNMGWQWYSLELSDKGTTMVEVARDILEKADPYRAHIWWYENTDQTWEPKE